jgi:hypothetical protein
VKNGGYTKNMIEFYKKMSRENTKKLPELLRPLFWQYSFGKLRLMRDKNLIIFHILSSGGKKHKNWLRQRIGDKAIREWLENRRGRGLMIYQMKPWIQTKTANRWVAMDPNAQLWENR